METIFIDIENCETNEPHRFRLTLADKCNLRDPNKNMALVYLSIYYTWKNIKSAYKTINLQYLLQLGMMNLICLMDYILFQTFKTILNNQYSIELKDRKYAERFGFLSFAK